MQLLGSAHFRGGDNEEPGAQPSVLEFLASRKTKGKATHFPGPCLFSAEGCLVGGSPGTAKDVLLWFHLPLSAALLLITEHKILQEQ